MAVAGIVAEFDPFHLGHLYLIDAVRHRLGAGTPVVAALSGCFTQRGGAAVCTPQARAEMALRGGADLVLELPLPFATASAEVFARGGVEVLMGTGVVDTLCFGSESGDVPFLTRQARALECEQFRTALRSCSAQGLPFAAARHSALEQVLGEKLPAGANDLLASEYLRFWPGEKPALAVPRRDGGHGGARSASRVRALLLEGRWEEALALLPPGSREVLLRERERGRCPACLDFAERAVLYRLRSMTAADFAALDQGREGLWNRLYDASRTAATLQALLEAAKTKRYALARLRRMTLWAYLGLTPADVPERMPYLRVLAASGTGCRLLAEMRTSAAAPVLTKPAQVRQLGPAARRLFAYEVRATDLYTLAYPRLEAAEGGTEWREGPVILGGPAPC